MLIVAYCRSVFICLLFPPLARREDGPRDFARSRRSLREIERRTAGRFRRFREEKRSSRARARVFSLSFQFLFFRFFFFPRDLSYAPYALRTPTVKGGILLSVSLSSMMYDVARLETTFYRLTHHTAVRNERLSARHGNSLAFRRRRRRRLRRSRRRRHHRIQPVSFSTSTSAETYGHVE